MQLVSVILLVLAPVFVHASPKPKHCNEIHHYDQTRPSGVYIIYPIGATSGIMAYCDMDTEGGGWTVIQRRMNGKVSFYRGWEEYKRGFGKAAEEYWLGLDNIHHLTAFANTMLRVSMEDFTGHKAHADYKSFVVEDESQHYKLIVTEFTGGKAGDCLKHHNESKFSTFDKDNDGSLKNCARHYLGAFWYKDCYWTNPNGIYLWGIDYPNAGKGVTWSSWKYSSTSMKVITMMIRPNK